MSLNTLAVTLMVTAAAATVLFVAGYAVRSPWRSNEVGKNTMLFMGVVAGVLLLALYFRITGATGPAWLSSVVWGALNVPLWWRVIILRKAQHNRYKVQLPPHECNKCGEVCTG